jgi:RNA polymerase sigma factor (sigma-70 family)
VAEHKENELFTRWLKADPADRPDVEAKLFAAVKSHGRAILWKKLNEVPSPELVEAVGVAVMTQMHGFRQECKFSTWVQEIAQRKAKEYIRGKVRRRKVFDEFVAVVEPDDGDDVLKPRVGEVIPTVSPQVEGEIAVKELLASLSKEDAALLRHKEKGLKSKEIAEAMGTTVEAVDSRLARLKPRLKDFRSPRRK